MGHLNVYIENIRMMLLIVDTYNRGNYLSFKITVKTSGPM